MNHKKRQSPTRITAFVIGVLLIIVFLLSYPVVRDLVNRRRAASKPSQKRLSLLDRIDLLLEYRLNKRLRALGVGLYRLTKGCMTRFAQTGVLLLTTRGRKSGKARTVLLQFFPDGANLVIIAANSGRSSHPDWFYNLKATPLAQVQILDSRRWVRAERLSDEEADAFWPSILRAAPANWRYLKATTRSIPLVRLAPVEHLGEQVTAGDEALIRQG